MQDVQLPSDIAQAWAPCDLYGAYEDARDEADASLAAWHAEPPFGRRAEAFAAYRAAADREDAAAAAWLHACAAYDARQWVSVGDADA